MKDKKSLKFFMKYIRKWESIKSQNILLNNQMKPERLEDVDEESEVARPKQGSQGGESGAPQKSGDPT